MGLFDWLSGLFGSKNCEENQDSENHIARNDVEDIETAINEKTESQNQTHNNLNVQMQDERNAESEETKFEEAITKANTYQDGEKT